MGLFRKFLLGFWGISSSVVFHYILSLFFFKHVRLVSCWVHPMLSVNAACASTFSLFETFLMMCRSTSELSLLVSMQFYPNYLITMTAHIAYSSPLFLSSNSCLVLTFSVTSSCVWFSLNKHCSFPLTELKLITTTYLKRWYPFVDDFPVYYVVSKITPFFCVTLQRFPHFMILDTRM